MAAKWVCIQSYSQPPEVSFLGGYSLLLLGPPTFQGPAGPLPVPGIRAQALLWYLASQSDRTFSRSHMAALLWESGSEADGRNSLNTTLSRLRQALPVWPLRTDREMLAWSEDAGAEVDIAMFRRLGRTAGRREERTPVLPAPAEREALATAVSLWRGPFLAGFDLPGNAVYEEWLERERDRYQQVVLGILSHLIALDEAAGDWLAMVAHARIAAGIDPFQEGFYRSLMKGYYHAGDRAVALAQYESCRRILEGELNVEPDPATTALRDAIAAGAFPRAQREPRGDVAVPSPAATVPIYPPLVGRDEVMRRLWGAVAAEGGGQPPLFLLHGEAGVGKTRLAREVLRRLQQPGAVPVTWLVGHGYEEAQDLPYAAIVESLEELLRRLDVRRLGVHPGDLVEVARLVPELSRLFPTLPDPLVLSPGQEQRRLFQGVVRFLTALPGSVVLVLDDIQWADEATLSLLAYLVRQPAARGRITVLATARAGDLPDQVERLLRQLQREGLLTWSELEPLSPDAIQSLVAAVTGNPDQNLGELIYAETRGNALFAVEFLRSIQENGVLQLDAAAQGTVASPGPDHALPQTVQSVVLGRLGRLPAESREVAAAAAIFPRGVSFLLLRQVAGLDEGKALDGLESLLRAGFLQEERGSASIAFPHDLIRRAVDGSLSRARRQVLHRRALLRLREAVGATAQTEQLAYHAVAGELWDQGLFWSQKGAEGAGRLHAYQTAIRLLEQALACLARMQPSLELRHRAIRIRLQLCQFTFFTGPQRLREWAEPAMAEAEALGDGASLTQLRLIQVDVLNHQGRIRESMAILEQVRPYVEAAGEEVILVRYLRARMRTQSLAGEYEEAFALAQQAIPLWDCHGTFLDQVYVRDSLASFHTVRGNLDLAQSIVGPLLERSREAGDRAALANVLAHHAFQAFFRGQWAQVAAYSLEAVQEAREAGQPGEEYWGGMFIGVALARLGDPEGGLRAQEQTLALASRMGTRYLLGIAYAMLGETLLEAGDPVRAEEAARTGFATAEAQGCRPEAAGCLRVLGTAVAAQGRLEEAREILQDALCRLETLGMVIEVARCHASLASLGNWPGKEEHFRRAEAVFVEMGMHWDLERLRVTSM